MSTECLKALEDIQSVIDGRIDYLNGLRKLPSSDLTQSEMSQVEGRLIEFFGRQLVTKNEFEVEATNEQLNRFPDFKQWLHVMDINQKSAEMLLVRLKSLGTAMKMVESEVRSAMRSCGCGEKEIARHWESLKNLRKVYNSSRAKEKAQEDGVTSPTDQAAEAPRMEPLRTEVSRAEPPATETTGPPEVQGGSPSNSTISESSSPEQKRPSISSVNSETSWDATASAVPVTTPPPDQQVFPIIPMPTPPHTPTSKRVRPKGTPPPNKKLTNLPLPGQSSGPWISAESLTLRPIAGESATLSRLSSRGRDPGLRRYSDDRSSNLPSPSRNVTSLNASLGALTDMDSNQRSKMTLQPKSPRTPPRSNMLHAIKHRFSKKPMMKTQNCDYCHEKIILQGYRCKDCKYQCHNQCRFQAEKVPSCGLPRRYEEVFKERIESGFSSSPIMPHKQARNNEMQAPVASSTGDSSSNPSSTTSSTPSSPAPFTTNSSSSISPPSPAQPSPRVTTSTSQFKFPPDVPDDILDKNENVRSTSSDRTITIDSHDNHDPFTDSERTLPEQVEPVDEVSDPEPSTVATRKYSQKLLSEWDIPFEQLVILDLIGTGRFGSVHKGKWHGDVAIKMIDIDTDDEEQLQAFKREVSIFRKTRHDFVVLFMGACMRPPHLAIVTSLCKGQTLYTHIHLRKDRFNINRTIQIATQIAQGMGYLHAKHITHKDLKSKNIFIENGKVVITDFALFSIGRLSKQKTQKDTLLIPDGWLCYLAPELITSLGISNDGNADMELPFTEKSDIYAFGTVWYELLAGEWPFHKQPAETVIWQVGKGVKQPLCHLQASRDVKDILMMCWSYSPDSRPTFPQIKKTILRLPRKKGLHRSPSHPLHLSRSAESVL
ncbi:kinase suppressor of Ras 2-like isoform X2 [Diadema setosum]|uniref:kinase suppressor of Ras 2-like isoform X2 n=1 Tax=Diadema setosum TaxID=31175 RepID=UPI003B3A7CC4